MRIPELRWDRRHNVAAVWVSFRSRIWHSLDLGDVVLGYNAAGRLARVLFLDPRRQLPAGARELQAIDAALAELDGLGHTRASDVDVLRSARTRALVAATASQRPIGPATATLPQSRRTETDHVAGPFLQNGQPGT